ncbi:MAG: DnaB-like helicase C-terminal domain-containing protein [Clostridia bacterium]
MENKITFNNILSKNILHDKLKQIYQNGLPKGYNLGLSNLDNIFRFDTSKLAVITGIPNHGKSEFVDFITCQLNKKYNLKTLYFSPENQPIELHISKLISKFTCKEFNSRNITDKELNNIENYIFNNFYFMNYMNIYTIDDILSEAERLITNENVKILVIDSYNKLESQKPSNMTETDYISKLLTN